MMRAAPFAAGNGAAPDAVFQARLSETLRARPSILAALETARQGEPAEITPAMHALRDAPLAERKSFYAAARVDDQRRWYGSKASRHDRSRETYFGVAVLVQLAAVIAAFLQWRPSGLNLVPLLVALSASLTAWSQAKRHEESALAYAVARQELDALALAVEAAAGEDAFAAAVAETEAAISREHTMWMARRNR
jgi:hypothetical protein